ncbi:MAG: 1-(5-phosphoribosyl)-5-[(5-phosphoribosylamino)methylideneamino]imidazole-4-carboxamide isomerase [Oceanipulchritudo sp.]
MIVYPAVDLKGGRVVRLLQGRADAETVYFKDASAPARTFREAGAEWVHVVDLDGAFTGEQVNTHAVEQILESGLKVELGGGVRSLEVIERWIGLGVQRVVIGTKAVTDPNFLHECLSRFPAEKIAVGIDAHNGKVAVKGWLEKVDLSAVEFAHTVQDIGIQTIIYTDISRDGMLSGPNFEAQEEMLDELEIRVVASGGVASIKDMERFKEIRRRHPNLDGVITGKAVYDGTLDLEEALRVASEQRPGACQKGEG